MSFLVRSPLGSPRSPNADRAMDHYALDALMNQPHSDTQGLDKLAQAAAAAAAALPGDIHLYDTPEPSSEAPALQHIDAAPDHRLDISAPATLIYGRRPQASDSAFVIRLPKSLTHLSRTHCTLHVDFDPVRNTANIRIAVSSLNGLKVQLNDTVRIAHGSENLVFSDVPCPARLLLGFWGWTSLLTLGRDLDAKSINEENGPIAINGDNGHNGSEASAAHVLDTPESSPKRRRLTTVKLGLGTMQPTAQPTTQQTTQPTTQPSVNDQPNVPQNDSFPDASRSHGATSEGVHAAETSPEAGGENALVAESQTTAQTSTEATAQTTAQTPPPDSSADEPRGRKESGDSLESLSSVPEEPSRTSSRASSLSRVKQEKKEHAHAEPLPSTSTEELRRWATQDLQLDLPSLTATAIVFRPQTTICLSDVIGSMLAEVPAMWSRVGGGEHTDRAHAIEAWRALVLEVLNSEPFFGCIENVGLKDAAGNPLEPVFYYVPENDPVSARREALSPFTRRVRSARTTGGGKRYFWRRPATKKR